MEIKLEPLKAEDREQFILRLIRKQLSLTWAAALMIHKSVSEKAESGLQGWVDCFGKAKFAGALFCGGLTGPGEAALNEQVLKKAYDFGQNL